MASSSPLPDHWEIANGYDPTVADDVTLDADKDGLNLLDEYLFGTHPTNAATFGTNDNLPDFGGTPASGLFPPFNVSTLTLDANGEGLIEFRVGLQPGNNYRIAATVFPTNNLASLQVTNPSAAYFVTASSNQVAGFNGDVSPMLTVWRKLHLEVDSMLPPPTTGSELNYVSGVVLGHITNGLPAGHTRINLRATAQLTDRNRFENGWIYITGQLPLRVVANDPFAVVVAGIIGTNLAGRSYSLQDDDYNHLTDLSLSPDQLPTVTAGEATLNQLADQVITNINRAYHQAYIHLTNANRMGLNPRPRIDFRRNYSPSLLALEINGGALANAKDLFDRDAFWAHTLVFAYQPETSEDTDPRATGEEPLRGITAKRTTFPSSVGGISAVYFEMAREEMQVNYRPGEVTNSVAAYWSWVYGTAAHEIGHAPGGQLEDTDHKEGELMSRGGSAFPLVESARIFEPATLRRFRATKGWSNYYP